MVDNFKLTLENQGRIMIEIGVIVYGIYTLITGKFTLLGGKNWKVGAAESPARFC